MNEGCIKIEYENLFEITFIFLPNRLTILARVSVVNIGLLNKQISSQIKN